jgi:multidrug efflux pump
MRFNLSRWAIEHPALIRYLMVSLMILGFSSYLTLGQDEDPPFYFRAMIVQADWPGASASQMADQVTDRLERILQEVPNVYRIRSFARPGHTTVIFELKDNFNPEEVPDRFYTVRKKMMDMARTLPQGVEGPYFNDDFGDTFGVIYALSAPGYSQADLTDLTREIRTRLLRVEDVGKVEVFGLQQERVFLELSRRQLARYGLTSQQVAQQISQQNAMAEAGALQTETLEIPLRVLGQFGRLEDLSDMPIRAGNSILRLGDIAQIRRGLIDPATPTLRFNGQEAVGLGISMQKGGDVVALGGALKRAVDEIGPTLPIGVTLQQFQDQPSVVASSVNEFLRVLAEAVAIVLGVSLIALGLHRHPWRLDPRPGLIVAISIPLVLAVTFLIMKLWGVGIHKISLGSLIIALGLLVDDAIIVVEMMVRKLEEGLDRVSAASAAFELTALPMLTGTLITAVGFLPIGMAKSAVGEYTFAIFAVTAAALLVSWVVSIVFVPFLGVWLLKPPAAVQEEAFAQGLPVTGFYARFRRSLEKALDYRKTVLSLTLATFFLGVLGMGKVEQQFFPDSARPEILLDVFLAEGSSQRATESAVQSLESALLKRDDVGSVTSWVGSGAPRFFLPLDVIFPQPNVAQLIVIPKPSASRKALLDALQTELPDVTPQARLRIKLLPNGPPVPYPVQIRMLADRPDILLANADKVATVMRAHPDLFGLNANWNETRPVAQISLDLARARELGVSASTVSQTLKARFSGVVVGEYREADKLLPIEMRLPAQERDALADLRGLLLPTANGAVVSLDKIATLNMVWEPGILWRANRQYALTLQAAVTNNRQGPAVSAEIMRELAPVIKALEPAIRIEEGGESEESSRGQASIIAGLPVMLFVIFTLLILQLQSTPKSLLVFATAPLGIAGVAAALLLLGRPFGFVAMLGFIALAGMIMRNSVILIDQIEKERAQGEPTREAIIRATVLRFRPICLTAAAAVLAMIPLQSSIFWAPMATSIMGGLIVATFLTLYSLPALYAAVYKA